MFTLLPNFRSLSVEYMIIAIEFGKLQSKSSMPECVLKYSNMGGVCVAQV